MSELPKGWEKTALENVLAQIIGGGTPSKNVASNFVGNIPFMTVKDMKSRFPVDTIDHISEDAVKSSATTLVPEDSLIVATRMSLGKVVRPTCAVAINQDLKVLVPATGLDKTFLEYFWRSQAKLIDELGTGTTVKGIRLDDIKNLELPLAPLPEQKRIADKLDATLARVDACRERLSRVAPILKRFRQSVLAAATSGQLTADWREQQGHCHAGNAAWVDENSSTLAADDERRASQVQPKLRAASSELRTLPIGIPLHTIH